MKTKKLDKMKHSRAGLWLLIIAAVALESIACIQYFYSRKIIRQEAVYRAQAELRSAELEINVAAVEMEAAAKVLAKMAESNLDKPEEMGPCTRRLLETLEDVESAGIAFVANYYPEHGRWYEVCSSRTEKQGEEAIYTREIGNADHDYLQAEWFHSGLTRDSAWWSEPYLDDAGARTMVVSCSYPIYDKQHNVVAVACIDVTLSRLRNVSEYLQVYRDSYYAIQSPSGMDIVARPDTTPGRKYLIFNEDIDATGWHLTIIIPEDIIFADLRRVGLFVSLLMFLSLALLAFIMYRTTKNFQNMVALNNQKERMEGELEIASTIQNAMLPKIFPPFSDRPDLNIFGMVQPAKEIGGDLYDFYVRQDTLFFCIGDVSGKGVPASLVMATVRSLFRSTSAHSRQPEQIVSEINNSIAEENDQNMFVTLFVGVLDLETGELQYCNAGHNAPILAHSMLDVLPNLPIGVLSGFEYRAQTTSLQRGDTLFLYTDGLTEAENSTHELFGEERMLHALYDTNGLQSGQVVKALQQSVESFVGDAPQSDDLTMLAIRYQVPAIIMRNDIQQIPTLSEWIEGLDIPMQLNMPINLALEEIVSNVMLYAYPGRNDGSVFVEFVQCNDSHGKRLVFTVSDSGVAFDPTKKEETDITLSAEERPIGGLGIHLVRQLMDEIHYERAEEKNILTLIKNI